MHEPCESAALKRYLMLERNIIRAVEQGLFHAQTAEHRTAHRPARNYSHPVRLIASRVLSYHAACVALIHQTQFNRGNKMKHTALITTLAILALCGCEKKSEQPFVPNQAMPSSPASSVLPAGHPPIDANDSPMPSADRPLAELTQKGTVVSTIDVPQFTYLEVKQENQTRWLASKTILAKAGDVIQFDNGSTMMNFTSKALNRTFPTITFVNRATVGTGE